MFPLQPTGFFQKGFNTSKPNSNESVAMTGAGAVNASNCYDSDPSSFGELTAVGANGTSPFVNFSGSSGSFPFTFPSGLAQAEMISGFLLYHSPTSGLVAATAPTISVSVSATASITSITKGANAWQDIVLFVCQPGTTPGSPALSFELVANGQDAHTALSGGGSYSVSLSKTINYPVYTGIDVNNIGFEIGWAYVLNDSFGPWGSIVGSFDAKITDVNIVWP